MKAYSRAREKERRIVNIARDIEGKAHIARANYFADRDVAALRYRLRRIGEKALDAAGDIGAR